MAANTATEELKTEHQAIKIMLSVLEEVAGKAERGEPVDRGDLLHMVEFIRRLRGQVPSRQGGRPALPGDGEGRHPQ